MRKVGKSMKKLNRFCINIIHSLIVRYLIHCGGAFHHNEYGPKGRYIALMNEEKYQEYTNI